ncbi:MAG: hypothetical protein E6I40_11495 [Chloroflexi bacterium]|nr:MAG: hypothetical protein E6I40_11495 [Chloroflexota bacterium]
MRRLGVLALVFVTAACAARPAPTPAPPSSSPTPTVAVATGSPAPTASPSPTVPPSSIKFGLVVADASSLTFRLRLESEAEPFASLDGSLATVSPDGRRLAYWHRDAGTNGTQDDLRILDLFTGTQSQIVRLQNERAAGVAWRDDAGGLLYAAASPNIAGGGIDPPPVYTAVRIVNFATNQVSEVKRLDAARFVPLTWRVTTHVLSGVNAGEGGVRTIYRFKEDGTTAGDSPADRRFNEVVDTTRDGTAILGQFAYGEGGKTFSGIRVVAADDPRPLAEREPPAGAFLVRARFRAATSDVVALLRAGDPSRYVIELWPTGVGIAPRRVWTGTTATAASGELLVRFDGKVAYVRTDESGTGVGTWQTVDLESGAGLQLATGQNAIPRGPSFLVTDDAVAKLRKP